MFHRPAFTEVTRAQDEYIFTFCPISKAPSSFKDFNGTAVMVVNASVDDFSQLLTFPVPEAELGSTF